ncbi:hypothetical protein Tco_1207775 [Tanacetum coccineum]
MIKDNDDKDEGPNEDETELAQVASKLQWISALSSNTNAGDMFPQRHVAGEKVGMLLGKASNVVVRCRIHKNT